MKKLYIALLLPILVACSTNTSTTLTQNVTSITTSQSSNINTISINNSYYSSIDFSKSGTELLKDLEKLLDNTDSTSFTYKKLFDVFRYTDVDPKNPNNGKIISFYSGTPSTESNMNREHTWPDSRGGNIVERDPHVIRPTIKSENSARGNSFFNENASWDPNSFKNEKYRGIAARIIFYAAVKAHTEGLYLIDLKDDPITNTTNNVTNSKWNPTMGKLSTLLKWNLQYDIDATETYRNEVLYTKFKHCRNPFIDNRLLAVKIWGNYNAETREICKDYL